MIYQLDWNVVWKEEICLREMREEGGLFNRSFIGGRIWEGGGEAIWLNISLFLLY